MYLQFKISFFHSKRGILKSHIKDKMGLTVAKVIMTAACFEGLQSIFFVSHFGDIVSVFFVSVSFSHIIDRYVTNTIAN